MKKTDKYSARLNALDAEYRTLLLAELRRLSEGQRSPYLENKCTKFRPFSNKQLKSEHIDQLVRLEKEVYQLAEAFDFQADITSTKILEDFVAAMRKGGSGQTFRSRRRQKEWTRKGTTSKEYIKISEEFWRETLPDRNEIINISRKLLTRYADK